MSKKKLSTQEILAAARAEVAKAAGDSESVPAPPEDASTETESGAHLESSAEGAASSDEAPSPQEKPKATPKSTAEILAAARAQAAGGGKKAVSSEAEPAAASPKGKTAPKSTAEILAAARAQAGAAKSAPKTQEASQAKASPKSAQKPAAAAAPTGEKLSVQEMIKAAREGKALQGTAPEEKELPKRPSKPKLPSPRKPKAAGKRSRRSVLLSLVATPFAFAWTALATTTGASLLALARFMFPNVLVEPPSRFKIGPPSDYPLGTVSTKWKATNGVWIVHTDSYKGRDLIYALISVCTHLGCTPNWLEAEQKFKCPCHGSGFYMNGINFEGPAPRPLERCGIRIAADGMLEVDKSLKFQEELGQWEDPTSYVDGTLV